MNLSRSTQDMQILIDTATLKTKYHNVNLKNVDWLSNPYDHNSYIFILHSMDYLLDLSKYYKETKKEEVKILIFQILKSFYKSIQNDLQNPWVFHDHATAMRASNISEIIEMKITTDINEIALLRKILLIDVKKLEQETFYSSFTNHGLDQSISLYKASFFIDDKHYSRSIKNIATQRINAELNFMFCEDGGHRENSPFYLVYGISQLQNALRLGKKYEGESSRLHFPIEKFAKILYNLSFFIQPNGFLPLIGDTTTFAPRNIISKELWGGGLHNTTEYQNFLYTITNGKEGLKTQKNELFLKQTGYVILKDNLKRNSQGLHFVFKCGFLSNYHRHDDDLHFTLFYDNEEWFVDGGLLEYEEKNKYRKYLRSHQNHNISFLQNAKAHRDLNLSKNTKIYNFQNTLSQCSFKGISYMFEGWENCREILYDKKKSIFYFKDYIHRVTTQENQEIPTNDFITHFLIPQDKKISINKSKNQVIIYGKNKIMYLVYKNFNGKIFINFGKDNVVDGWLSRNIGKKEKAYSLYFTQTNKTQFEFKIFFKNKKSILKKLYRFISIITKFNLK